MDAERLARTFVEAADTLADDFDVVRFSQLLTRRVAGLFDAGQAGMMLADHDDQLAFVAASDETTQRLELLQLRHDEGPGPDAFRTARPVTHRNLAEAQGRWPRFAPRAVQAGFESVHAFPLRLRDQVIGVLSVFGCAAGLRTADINITHSLTEVAAIGLLQQRAIHRGLTHSEQLQGALSSRIVIEQAKGIVAQARGVGPEEAFALIRSYARSHNQRISETAASIVTGLPALPGLALPEARPAP